MKLTVEFQDGDTESQEYDYSDGKRLLETAAFCMAGATVKTLTIDVR